MKNITYAVVEVGSRFGSNLDYTSGKREFKQIQEENLSSLKDNL